MTIQARQSPEKDLTITLGETFDFNCVEDFRNAYANNEAGQRRSYVVDFRNTHYIDSSALGMLINLQKYAQERNSQVRLINPSPQIRKILAISRFDKKFAIE